MYNWGPAEHAIRRLRVAPPRIRERGIRIKVRGVRCMLYVRYFKFLHTHKEWWGKGGATLASPHPDTGRSPTAFKVQALARCTWVSSPPLPPDKAQTNSRTHTILAIE